MNDLERLSGEGDFGDPHPGAPLETIRPTLRQIVQSGLGLCLDEAARHHKDPL